MDDIIVYQIDISMGKLLLSGLFKGGKKNAWITTSKNPVWYMAEPICLYV